MLNITVSYFLTELIRKLRRIIDISVVFCVLRMPHTTILTALKVSNITMLSCKDTLKKPAVPAGKPSCVTMKQETTQSCLQILHGAFC